MKRRKAFLISISLLLCLFAPAFSSVLDIGYGLSMILICISLFLISLTLSNPLRPFTPQQVLVISVFSLYILLVDVLTFNHFRLYSLYSLLSFASTLLIASQIPIPTFTDFQGSLRFLYNRRFLSNISISLAFITLAFSASDYFLAGSRFSIFSEPSHYYILASTFISYTILTVNPIRLFLLFVLYLISFCLSPSLILIFIVAGSSFFRFLIYRTSSILSLSRRNLLLYPFLLFISIFIITNSYTSKRILSYSENLSSLVLIRSYESLIYSLTHPYLGNSFSSGQLPPHFTSFWSQNLLDLRNSGWISSVDLSTFPGQLSLVLGSFGSLIAICVLLLLLNFLLYLTKSDFIASRNLAKISYVSFLVALSFGALSSFVRFAGISSPSFIYLLVCVFRPSKYVLFHSTSES